MGEIQISILILFFSYFLDKTKKELHFSSSAVLYLPVGSVTTPLSLVMSGLLFIYYYYFFNCFFVFVCLFCPFFSVVAPPLYTFPNGINAHLF